MLVVNAIPTVTHAQFTYSTNMDNTLTITGYTGPPGPVTLPSNINGLSVNGIAENAFKFNGDMTGVTIPSNITTIGDAAFWACSALGGVTLEEGFKSMGSDMFAYCVNLTNVMIPETVTSISDNAFFYCSGLQTISIPSSVGSIGAHAFEGSGLNSLVMPDSVTNMGFATFASCQNLTNCDLGSGVTAVVNWMFDLCTGLTNLVIPGNIISLDDYAFYGCTNLTTLTLSNGLGSVGGESGYVFEGCTNLRNLVIPGSITNIGTYAFQGCSLTNVTILGSANIGEYAFAEVPLSSVYIQGGSIGAFSFELCTNLTSLTLGTGLTNIGLDAFNSDPITNLVIPGSVNTIGEDAFAVSQLTNLIISEGVSTIGEGAFALNHITSLIIPSSVTSIGDQAFYMSINLTNIIIGRGVSNIYTGAFMSCGNPANFFFLGNEPAVIGNQDGPVFGGDINTTVYYLPETAGWGNSYQGVPTVMWDPIIQTGWPSFGVSNGQFGFNITSKANIPIVVAASTNLGSGPWVPLLSCTLTNIDDAPPLYFSDPFWSNYPSRFYRIAFPGQYPTITGSPSMIITNAGFGIGNNQFGFTITGPANISVTVQATTNLPGGSWTNLQSFTLTNGSIYFTDPGWTNYPSRFYRIAYPPAE